MLAKASSVAAASAEGVGLGVWLTVARTVSLAIQETMLWLLGGEIAITVSNDEQTRKPFKNTINKQMQPL